MTSDDVIAARIFTVGVAVARRGRNGTLVRFRRDDIRQVGLHVVLHYHYKLGAGCIIREGEGGDYARRRICVRGRPHVNPEQYRFWRLRRNGFRKTLDEDNPWIGRNRDKTLPVYSGQLVISSSFCIGEWTRCTNCLNETTQQEFPDFGKAKHYTDGTPAPSCRYPSSPEPDQTHCGRSRNF